LSVPLFLQETANASNTAKKPNMPVAFLISLDNLI
jgi:hypothetical protein